MSIFLCRSSKFSTMKIKIKIRKLMNIKKINFKCGCRYFLCRKMFLISTSNVKEKTNERENFSFPKSFPHTQCGKRRWSEQKKIFMRKLFYKVFCENWQNKFQAVLQLKYSITITTAIHNPSTWLMQMIACIFTCLRRWFLINLNISCTLICIHRLINWI